MKYLSILLLTLVTLTSHAQLTQDCKSDILEVVDNYELIITGYQKGKITDETIDLLLNGNRDAAEAVAIECGKLAITSVWNSSFFDGLGVVSKSNQVVDEALDLYEQEVEEINLEHGVER